MLAARTRFILLTLSLIAADQIVISFMLARGSGEQWLGINQVISQSAVVLVLWPAFFIFPARIRTTYWYAWALILAGWCSNNLALLRVHRFIDFVPLGGIYTNTADLCICIGTAVLIVGAVVRLKKP